MWSVREKMENTLTEDFWMITLFAGLLMLWLGDVWEMGSIQSISETRGDTYSSFAWLWVKIAGAFLFVISLAFLLMFY